MRDYQLFFLRGRDYSNASLDIWFTRLLKLAGIFMALPENGPDNRRIIAMGIELQERIHRVADHCGPFGIRQNENDKGIDEMLAALGICLMET